MVDDRQENLMALEAILENEGYTLVKANSGRQALQHLLENQDFHLIIMDVVMPGMDGFETAELIYDREKLKNIPIIFLTAIDTEENIYRGYQSGAVDYISKPFIPGLLRAKVAAFVELSSKSKKLIQQEEKLREINKSLEEEIAERKASEKKIKELNSDLKHKLNELQSLDAFAYSVSHDLMSPLNNISGLTTLIIHSCGELLDDESKNMLNLILSSTQKMSDLIKSILIFSRQANAELIKNELDMNEIISTVLTEIKAYKTIDHFEIEIAPLPNVMADTNMLKQVWVNFISNAIKYSEKKQNPKIEIGHYISEEEIVFFVKDNGAGFDMVNYDKLFSIFKRLHSAQDFEGTGIGLAIVKRVIERHNGRVWADASLDKGSTFYFSLKTSDIVSEAVVAK